MSDRDRDKAPAGESSAVGTARPDKNGAGSEPDSAGNGSSGGRRKRGRRRRGGRGGRSGANAQASGDANGAGGAGGGGRGKSRKNGGRSQAGDGRRSRRNAARYRRKVDEELFGKKGDRGRLRLVERLREAHGSPAFTRTWREYLKTYGMPEDVGLLMLLLDLDEERDVLQVLEGIEGAVDTVSPEQKSLLRSRLRNLEMSTSFDGVADATEDLLERF